MISAINKLREEYRSIDSRLEICLILTLVNLLLFGSAEWYTKAGLAMFVLVALIVKQARYSVATWFAIGIVLLLGTSYDWATTDNHKYAMSYWALAIGFTLIAGKEKHAEVIATNGRLLLGLVMGFAVFWKLTSTSYTSGEFFELTFLTDARFAGFIGSVTDVSSQDLLENQSRFGLLTKGYVDNINPESQQLISSVWLTQIAKFTTWWTVAIEGIAALAFLIPGQSLPHRIIRHATLIIFGITTYAIAPVPGFGLLLICMGVSLCLERDEYWLYAYLFLYVFVILSTFAGKDLWKLVNQMM